MIISAKTKTFLRLFHKYIGFIFSIFIFLLTVTGILLLYPKFFGLNNTFISSSYILKKYNMLNTNDVINLSNNNKEIILLENSIYFEKVLIDNFSEEIISASYQNKTNNLIVFLENKIIFYRLGLQNSEIDILDITEMSLNHKLIRVGKSLSNKIFIGTDSDHYYIKDQKLFKDKEETKIDWFNRTNTDKNIAKSYLEIHQGKGVPLHRIVTELHNGKILGSFLSYILLLSSLSLIFLIISSFFFGINIKKADK